MVHVVALSFLLLWPCLLLAAMLPLPTVRDSNASGTIGQISFYPAALVLSQQQEEGMHYIKAHRICPLQSTSSTLASFLHQRLEAQAWRLLFPSGKALTVSPLVINPVAPTADLSPGCPFASQSSVQFTPAVSHLETIVISLWEWSFFQVLPAPGKSAVAADR